MTAFAGLLPMFNEIYQSRQIQREIRHQALAAESNAPTGVTNAAPSLTLERLLVSRHWLHPVWSAVLLAAAATLLAMDRFYGTTSGWVRYLLTAQQLTDSLDDFELAFEAPRASWGNPEPTPEQTAAALALIQKFAKQVNGIVGDETKAWAADFAEVLKQFDEEMKQANQARRQSALQLTVTNGDLCKTGWKLAVAAGSQKIASARKLQWRCPPGFRWCGRAERFRARPRKPRRPSMSPPGKSRKWN